MLASLVVIMRQIKNILLLGLVLCHFELFAQDTLDMKEVYMDNLLVYKIADNERFTGIAQMKKKNGRVVLEEEYKDGVILFDYQYYRGAEKEICYKTEYNRYKLWVKQKEYFYPKSKDWYELVNYDENGKKVLLEQFEEDQLFYSCEYSGKKKHGKEICFDDNGDKLIFHYVNGKKVKK